jgi:arylsulfatase A-like enzyme
MLGRREFLTASAASALKAQARPRPNVVLLLTDDQGYGDLSSHGNPSLKTPNLDALRAGSARLTDFHVAPMCTPTRSQLLTGRHSLVNMAMNVSSGRTLLRRDIPTLADLFRASGYATGQFGKWHLGDNYPYRPRDRGFDESVWFPSSHVGSAADAWNNDYFDDRYRHNETLESYKGYCTDVFFEQAMQWMRKQAAARRPFFTYLPTNAPHGPLFVPEQHTRPYAHLPQNLARFFGMIANIDENVGRLEAMLKQAGIADDTIFIYMTDNGATAGLRHYNAGMRSGKVTLWDGGHRVPFFLRWAKGGVVAGKDVPELTHAQDVLPTLAELCSLEIPKGTELEGTSLAPALRGTGAAPKDRNLVVQFSRMNIGKPQWGDSTVMWNQYRLVSMTELYDVAKDPGQRDNVAARMPELANRMRAHYERWWRDVEPRFDSFLPVHIGSTQENPTLLSPTEWADSFLDQGTQIRAGVPVNGPWHVHAEEAGEYQFTLRRWPKEVTVPMQAGLPAHKGECGEYAAGVALPIARADLRINGRRSSAEIKAGQEECVFRLQVPEGRTMLQTWFHDGAGRELCGAYFCYAERLRV